MTQLEELRTAYIRFPVCSFDDFLKYYAARREGLDSVEDWIKDVVEQNKSVTAVLIVTTADDANRTYKWFGKTDDAYGILNMALENNLDILFEVDYEKVCTAQWDRFVNGYRFYDAVGEWTEAMKQYN